MDSARELVELMAQFGRAYMRWLRSRVEEESGSHATQTHLLHVLHCKGPQKMHELGHHLGVTPRNVTKLVDALEAEGLVCRREMPQDRRAVLVELSEAGRARQQEEFGKGLGAAAVLFEEHLSEADRAELIRLIRQVLAGLEEGEGR